MGTHRRDPQELTSPLRGVQVLEISFDRFTPRITFHSERELTVEVIAGDNAGFVDTVEYEAVAVRDQLVVLSWQEHIGSTIVHVLDFASRTAYTAITPATGGFTRLVGQIETLGRVDARPDPPHATRRRSARPGWPPRSRRC